MTTWTAENMHWAWNGIVALVVEHHIQAALAEAVVRIDERRDVAYACCLFYLRRTFRSVYCIAQGFPEVAATNDR